MGLYLTLSVHHLFHITISRTYLYSRAGHRPDFAGLVHASYKLYNQRLTASTPNTNTPIKCDSNHHPLPNQGVRREYAVWSSRRSKARKQQLWYNSLSTPRWSVLLLMPHLQRLYDLGRCLLSSLTRAELVPASIASLVISLLE